MNLKGKVTAKEAAAILDVHHSTVRRLIRRKRLKGKKTLGTYLLDEDSVRRFGKIYTKHERD